MNSNNPSYQPLLASYTQGHNWMWARAQKDGHRWTQLDVSKSTERVPQINPWCLASLLKQRSSYHSHLMQWPPAHTSCELKSSCHHKSSCDLKTSCLIKSSTSSPFSSKLMMACGQQINALMMGQVTLTSYSLASHLLQCNAAGMACYVRSLQRASSISVTSLSLLANTMLTVCVACGCVCVYGCVCVCACDCSNVQHKQTIPWPAMHLLASGCPSKRGWLCCAEVVKDRTHIA